MSFISRNDSSNSAIDTKSETRKPVQRGVPITLNIAQYNFNCSSTTLSLSTQDPIIRLQREIATHLHDNAVLPSNVIVFVEKKRVQLDPDNPPSSLDSESNINTNGDHEIPNPVARNGCEFVIAQPHWLLGDCFKEPNPSPSGHHVSELVTGASVVTDASPLKPKNVQNLLLANPQLASNRARSKSSIFMESLHQLNSDTTGNLNANQASGKQSGVDVLYDVLPYARVVDYSTYVPVFYPRRVRSESNRLPKSCVLSDAKKAGENVKKPHYPYLAQSTTGASSPVAVEQLCWG
ncbi:hypothetical protein HDU80_008660 [Chytriomyces hyalinus]|nr:hypothetical protein HDU80_008660 [Chytriomyces hyalinus]